MREAQPTQARNWRAIPGLSRSFPVRHDPSGNANTLARGGTLSLPRVCLRLSLKHRITYIAVLVFLSAFSAVHATAASSPDPWAGLDNGRVGDYLWEVKAKRQAGSSGREGAKQPCVMVGTTWELGPFNYRRSRYRACAGAEGSLTAADPPLLATGVQPSSGETVKMTAVGMIFAPAVRQVQITLSDGRQQTIRLHRFSATQANAARLSRFEYAAFAIRGLWCAERMISQSATGRTLWDRGPDGFPCGADGSATTFE
jgi:hypothetical protein